MGREVHPMEMRIRMGTAKAKMQQAAERRKARLKSPERYCFVIGSDYSCHINSNYINQKGRKAPKTNMIDKKLSIYSLKTIYGYKL
jgi:hypothetical protein